MQLLLFPECPPWHRDATLSLDEQRDVLQALLRGGSPQAICQKAGRDPLDFCRTIEGHSSFQTALRQARELMTLNVVATVYRAAIEGTPAAQALWLRTFPPTEWTDSDASPSATDSERTDDETSLSNEIHQILAAFHKDYAGWICADAHSDPA